MATNHEMRVRFLPGTFWDRSLMAEQETLNLKAEGSSPSGPIACSIMMVKEAT